MGSLWPRSRQPRTENRLDQLRFLEAVRSIHLVPVHLTNLKRAGILKLCYQRIAVGESAAGSLLFRKPTIVHAKQALYNCGAGYPEEAMRELEGFQEPDLPEAQVIIRYEAGALGFRLREALS